MADNNKEAAVSVYYFKTLQYLVHSTLAFIIKLMPFDLRPLACVLWNLEEIQEKIAREGEGGRDLLGGMSTKKKRQGKTQIPNCSISLIKKCACPLRGKAGKDKVPILAPQVCSINRTYGWTPHLHKKLTTLQEVTGHW